MNSDQQKVIAYYSHPETRLGFDYLLWGSKHFGYYPTGKADITEKAAQVILQDLVAKNLTLKADQVILDAGCGQGIVSTYLSKKYRAKIFGITLVPFEVKKARERAERMGVSDQTEYHVMDYSSTTFSDNYFDAIYTTETLSHSPNVSKTLQEFFRILKPGGRVALFEYTVAPEERFSAWEKRMFDTVMEGSAMMGLKDFRHNEFPKSLDSVGFENAREQNITRNIQPSFHRLHKLSRFPYSLIRLLKLQRFFINTTAGYEYYKMAEKDLLRYCIFTANKPSQP